MSDDATSPGESFRVQAQGECTKCGVTVEGWIAFNQQSHVIDSGGYMVFADGLTCDECLGAAS